MPSSSAAVDPGSSPKQPSWSPNSDADRDAIRRHVDRILASPLFRNSRRFPSFLQYTVEHALTPDAGPLKERTIGIEVFSRQPDYDTAQDPVVRMTAAEVRKRLAQYYQSPEGGNDFRITFQPGSYVPEFSVPTPTEPASVASELEGASREKRRTFSALALAATVLVVVSAAGVAGFGAWKLASGSGRPIDQFWAPLIDSPSPVLLCIGDPTSAGQKENPEASATLPMSVDEIMRRNYVRFTDSVTLAVIAGELGERRKAFRIRRPKSTEFIDLKDGPSVFIGGFNNPWTLRLSEDLRFTLATEGAANYIRDRQEPAKREWRVPTGPGSLELMRETYGIITRMLDPKTGQPVLMTSGLLLGTRAAAECLVDAACMSEARRLAQQDWSNRNIQIVVSTTVVDEDLGVPRVVAVHLW
jgi:hypothetical protein